MRKYIYQFRKFVSLLFVKLALMMNSHKICALILWLNIRKFKNINYKNNNIKKILVFSKSGGNEDLIESFKNYNKNNIIFYWIPRSFLKKIFFFYFKRIKKDDYFTKLNSKNQINKKNYTLNF